MKHIILLLAVALTALFAVTGCSTPTTIEEYDAATGKLTKKTVTERDAIDKITESTKGKVVIAWSNGWAFYIKAVVTEAESGTVTPTGEIYGGKISKGYASIPSGFSATNLDIPLMLAATHENISVGFNGISSASDNARAATSSSGTSVNGGTITTEPAASIKTPTNTK